MSSGGPGGSPHVLLIHQLFVTTGQAGGTRHYELAREWVARGWRVTVVAGARSYLTGEVLSADESLPEGLRVHRIGTLPAGGGGFVARVANFVAFMVRALWTALRIEGVDVVVGTSPPLFQACAAAAVARLRGVPFVLEIRDLWPDFAVELGVLRNSVLIGASRRLERWLYRSADRIVVNSPGFVDHVEACGVGGVDVVPNGVDCAPFDPDADGASFRAREHLEGEFLVVYAGAHGIPNDLGTVLDAAERLGAAGPLWLLVGGGRDKARLVEEASRRGLDGGGLGRVRFLPPVPKDVMPEVLAAADLTLAILAPLPLFGTVYPNKVFDYMAAGRPVVLAIDGAIREVVEVAEAGTWVPSGNPAALAGAVAAYRENPALGPEQGRRGRAWVERHFRRADQAEAFLRTLVRVVEGPGSASLR